MNAIRLGLLGLGLLAWVAGATPVQAASHEAATHASGFDRGMGGILEDYLKIQAALAADSTEGVREAAERIGQQAAQLDPSTVEAEHADHYRRLPERLAAAAAAVAGAGDLAAAREAFKALSQPMAAWGTLAAPPGIDLLYCPMVKASWLQSAGDVRNPYAGASMLGCGERVSTAPAAEPPQAHGEHADH